MKHKFIIIYSMLCTSFLGNSQNDTFRDLIISKQYATIIDHAASLSAVDSLNVQTMYIIGQAYEGLLKYRDAHEYYKYCLKFDTLNIDMLNAIARTSINLGKASEAKHHFLKILSTDSLNFYANYHLARLYYQLGDYENALTLYQSLLEQEEDNVTLLKNEGDCFLRLENSQSAISSYSQAYNLNKENASLGSALINVMLSVGGDFVDKALDICDTALYYNSGNRLLEQNKSMALYMSKRYMEADSLYSLLMEKGDSSYLTLKYGGVSRYYAGQYLRAIEALEAAYGKDSTSTDICLLLGSAFSKTYDIKRAYILFDKAEENMKPSPFLLNQLTLFRAETFHKDMRYNEAANLYYNFWKSNPKRMDLLWHITSIYFANNQSEYENDAMRQRGLFAYSLFAAEFIKSGENPIHLSYARGLLESFYEDAFFQGLTELPVISPNGEKNILSVEELGNIIKQIPQR